MYNTGAKTIIDQFRKLSETIERIDQADTKQALLDHLNHYVKSYGFRHVGIGQLVNPALADKPLSEYGVSNFPQEHTNRWFDDNLIMHDPVTQYATRARNAFTWDVARKFGSKFGQRLMNEARDLSLDNGLGVPVVIPKMPIGLVTMSHDDPDLSAADMLNVELASIHAYTRFLDLIKAEPQHKKATLTYRETEVLHYVAAGRTNFQIGCALCISEETVRVHTKNIMRKLNAANRAHSVTIAMNDGSIMP